MDGNQMTILSKNLGGGVILIFDFFSHEHSRRRPNCPHVVNKEYIKPASFDFILAGESDDLAVKDITQQQQHQHQQKQHRDLLVPKTPARNTTVNPGQSTVKSSKKIRISVPSLHTDTLADITTATATATKTITESESTPKSKNIKISMTSASTVKNFPSTLKEFSSIFPDLKTDEILNLTMEQFFDRLIREKVLKFEDFLRRTEAENCEEL